MAHVLVELHRIRAELRAEIAKMENPCGLVDIEQRLSDLVEVEILRRVPLSLPILRDLGWVLADDEPRVLVNAYPSTHPR